MAYQEADGEVLALRARPRAGSMQGLRRRLDLPARPRAESMQVVRRRGDLPAQAPAEHMRRQKSTCAGMQRNMTPANFGIRFLMVRKKNPAGGTVGNIK